MSNRAGLRSPASAASRMRVASDDLLDCACCSGDNELHAKSSATCMFLTVSGLKSLTSATMNVPEETHGVANLARNALARLSDARRTGGLLHLWKANNGGRAPEQEGLIRLTQASGRLSQRIQHRLQVECPATDDLQDFGGRALLL